MIRSCLFLFSMIVAFEGILKAQSYYPLQVGNRWDYNTESWSSITGTTYSKLSKIALRDTVLSNGKTYSELNVDLGVWGFFARNDTDGVHHFSSMDSVDYLVYDLDAPLDSVRIIDQRGYRAIRLGAVDTQTVFGIQTITRTYYDGPSFLYSIVLSDKFGPIKYDWGGDPPGTDTYSMTLSGCIIADTVYGTLLSVDDPRLLLPSDIRLSRNYPNPFNSTTTFQFTTIHSGPVEFTIFNQLGQHVYSNSRYFQPGKHIFTWSANNHPSGVYFLRLRTHERSDIQSMILIR